MSPQRPRVTARAGTTINSETQPGVSYLLEQCVGEGGMGTAYLARRRSAQGESSVVIKVMNPDFSGGQVAPDVVATKEAVALQRLNETLPPSPYVVRFVDAGSASFDGERSTPWTAIEYVHGGVEGTTLEDRVTYAVHKTGYAFDAVRTAHAVRCLTAGLAAIHYVGVIHRDVTPGNVLCCGFGSREIFKIADFGVARTSGVALTFNGLCLGTVGYSPPEAAGANASPATDVFAFACVVYYMLTGQHYFAAESPVEAVQLILSPTRPRIADHATLSPDLAQEPELCAIIDRVICSATALDPRQRYDSPNRFAAELLACLGEHSGPRSSEQLFSAVQSSRGSYSARHRFVVRSLPQSGFEIQSAAWESDGHALVLLANGGRFWNGDTWLDAEPVLSKLGTVRNFTHRNQSGGWLVGGDVLSVVDARGISDSLKVPLAGARFKMASGRIDDLLLAAGEDAHGSLMLWPVVARRFLKPLPLQTAGSISALLRLDDHRFLVAGATRDGTAFAGEVFPLEWELRWFDLPAELGRACGAALAERSTALLVGKQGFMVRIEQESRRVSCIPGEPELTAAAIDELGREWVAGRGALWSRDPAEGEPWTSVWRDDSWGEPFVAMLAEPGRILAMTSGGAILEGVSSP